jgi:hypothetical protein
MAAEAASRPARGLKPTLRIAANSSAVSALPHVPLPLTSAIRVPASTGVDHHTTLDTRLILRDQPDGGADQAGAPSDSGLVKSTQKIILPIQQI